MRLLLAATMLCAAATACVSAPRVAVPARAVAATSRADFESRLLAAHNAERLAMRVPRLGWDPLLAAQASTYARELAASGRFEHSDRAARGGTGENLWMGTRGAFGLEQMIGNWASEKRWFVPGLFPSVSRTGRWSDVGHYTQMIWPGTMRVGCGLASSGARDVLVCRYAPAGNINGRRVP